MRWTTQSLQNLPLHRVYPVARELILERLENGQMVGRSSFDQNAGNHTKDGYIGISNKQLMMVAAALLEEEDVGMDDAWDLFMEVSFGRE